MYQTTITSKGQIVIPKKIRELLGVESGSKMTIYIEEKEKKVILDRAQDILDIAGSLRPRKVKSALSVRNNFEKRYDRK